MTLPALQLPHVPPVRAGQRAGALTLVVFVNDDLVKPGETDPLSNIQSTDSQVRVNKLEGKSVGVDRKLLGRKEITYITELNHPQSIKKAKIYSVHIT